MAGRLAIRIARQREVLVYSLELWKERNKTFAATVLGNLPYIVTIKKG